MGKSCFIIWFLTRKRFCALCGLSGPHLSPTVCCGLFLIFLSTCRKPCFNDSDSYKLSPSYCVWCWAEPTATEYPANISPGGLHFKILSYWSHCSYFSRRLLEWSVLEVCISSYLACSILSGGQRLRVCIGCPLVCAALSPFIIRKAPPWWGVHGVATLNALAWDSGW